MGHVLSRRGRGRGRRTGGMAPGPRHTARVSSTVRHPGGDVKRHPDKPSHGSSRTADPGLCDRICCPRPQVPSPGQPDFNDLRVKRTGRPSLLSSARTSSSPVAWRVGYPRGRSGSGPVTRESCVRAARVRAVAISVARCGQRGEAESHHLRGERVLSCLVQVPELGAEPPCGDGACAVRSVRDRMHVHHGRPVDFGGLSDRGVQRVQQKSRTTRRRRQELRRVVPRRVVARARRSCRCRSWSRGPPSACPPGSSKISRRMPSRLVR